MGRAIESHGAPALRRRTPLCVCDPAMSVGTPKYLGKMGEHLACQELRRRGYAVLARGYRSRFGEIDIIARQHDAVVFVEVKARQGEEYGGAGAAVTAWKQRRIARTALDFLARRGWLDEPCRFDVVTIQFDCDRPRIEVYVDAFTV